MFVVAINNKNRPSDIPESKWIKENDVYTVIDKVKCNMQGGIIGYKLEEINLDGCEPYMFYAANRFAVLPELPLDILEEKIKDSVKD